MDSLAIVAAYQAAPDSWLRSVLLVEYRCREGCLLLHVWQSPGGAMYYRPPGPLPMGNGMGWNRLPAHGGNVSDFDTSDRGHAWVVGDEVPGVMFDGLILGCGHLYGRFAAAEFAADARAVKPGQPMRRTDFWSIEPAVPLPRERKRRR